MKDEVSFTIMPVSPDMANMWLKKNKGNRNVRKTHVNYLAGLMERGEFLTTHQPIAFDRDGWCVDGQHRLYAIIKSGCTCRIVVSFYACSKDYVFPAIDSCAIVRSTSDITGIDTKKVAIANAFLYGVNHTFLGKDIKKVSPEQTMESYITHKESIDWAYDHLKTKAAPSNCYMWHQMCIWYEKNKTDATIFIEGYMRIRDDIQQANALRESLIISKVKSNSINRFWVKGRTLYCIEQYRRGKKANMVSVRDGDLF